MTGFPTSFNPLRIRRRLGREIWAAPITYGPDGWVFQNFDGKGSIVLSCAPVDVDIHEYALHIFGRLDGKPALPDFTNGTGSI